MICTNTEFTPSNGGIDRCTKCGLTQDEHRPWSPIETYCDVDTETARTANNVLVYLNPCKIKGFDFHTKKKHSE